MTIELAETAQKNLEPVESLASSIEVLAGAARPLRGPTKRIADGLRGLKRLSKPILGWGDRIKLLDKSRQLAGAQTN
jgi:hypothetical protein